MDRLYSFVLPAYKVRFFKESIDSILAQTYTNFELVVVNDASPEDLEGIIKLYDDPRIKYYVNKENIGGKDLVAQWNTCLNLSKGEYIILASDDDVYHPRYLEIMNSLITKYSNINIFRPRVQFINEMGKIVGFDGYLKEEMTQLEYLHAWIIGWIGSGIPFYVFRKESLIAIGGFVKYPLAWFSDDATAFELAREGVATSNEILFSFRMSGENISTKKQSYKVLLQKVNAAEKFYNFIKDYIESLDTDDDVSMAMVNSIRQKFYRFIRDNKVFNHMFNTSIWNSLLISYRISKLEFVSVRSLIKRWLQYGIDKIHELFTFV